RSLGSHFRVARARFEYEEKAAGEETPLVGVPRVLAAQVGCHEASEEEGIDPVGREFHPEVDREGRVRTDLPGEPGRREVDVPPRRDLAAGRRELPQAGGIVRIEVLR